MPKSNFLRGKVVDRLYRGDTSYTFPTTWYWALVKASALPAADNAGGQYTTGEWSNYGRVSTPQNVATWGALGNPSATSLVTLTFTAPPGGNPAVENAGAVAAFDALTGGNFLAYGIITDGSGNPATVAITPGGSNIVIPIGNIIHNEG